MSKLIQRRRQGKGKNTKSFTGVIAAVLRGVSELYVLSRSRVLASKIYVRYSALGGKHFC